MLRIITDFGLQIKNLAIATDKSMGYGFYLDSGWFRLMNCYSFTIGKVILLGYSSE
jgi:hypothetical protein